MDFLNDIPKAFAYIGGHPDEFKGDLATHMRLSGLAIAIAFAICFPLGVLASRSRFASIFALNTGGILRAIPSVAILFVLYPYLGLGFEPTLVALTVLAAFPILTNTNAGFRSIEPSTREAAYGMGMTTLQVLGRIELPLASPIVIAGLRTTTRLPSSA
jgi:osmoprotectant transport system permease protein